jgi:3-(3-hydroxy-phenyl)propionate hydroxylase
VEDVTATVKRLGQIICKRDPVRAAERDELPAGTPFPQAMGCIEPGVAPQMMDDLLQPGFLLVLRHAPDPAALRALETSAAGLGAQLLCIDATTTVPGVVKLAEADGILVAWFERHGCEAALVRPDHLVYGVARSVEDAAVLMRRASRHIGIQPPTRANPKAPTARSAA